jgi:adenine phosphoribosyltransferase
VVVAFYLAPYAYILTLTLYFIGFIVIYLSKKFISGVYSYNMDFSEQIRDKMNQDGGRYYTALTVDKPDVRNKIIEEMIPESNFDSVVGMETMGFPFAVLIAEETNSKFIPMREQGKIPVPDDRLRSVDVGYEDRKKTLEIDREQFKDVEGVLLVDDWIESGEQLVSAVQLLESVNIDIDVVSVLGTDFGFKKPKSVQDIEIITAIE